MEEIIKNYVKEKEFKKLKEMLINMPIADIAENIKDLEIDEIAKIIRLLNKDIAADLFSELPLSIETKIISKPSKTNGFKQK